MSLSGFIKWLIVTALLTWIAANCTYDCNWVAGLCLAAPVTTLYQLLRPRRKPGNSQPTNIIP